MSSSDEEDQMGATGTAAKAAPKQEPPAAGEPVEAGPVLDAAGTASAMLAAVREQAQQMLAETQQAAQAMLEAARAEAADVSEQARLAAATVSEDRGVRAQGLVDQGRRQFEQATTGDGRVWQQHEVEQDYIPVTFVAAAGKKSELRILRIARHEYSHANRTEVSPGVAYQFSQGELTALSSDVEAYLKARPGYGILFWEIGEEPTGTPDASKMLEQVLDAVLELDDAALKVLQDKELAGHRRPDVLKAILHGRRSVRGRTGTTQGDE